MNARDGNLTYVTEANIFNQSRVNLGLGQGLLQQGIDHVIQFCVLESALARLGQRGTECKCDDNIVGVLLGARCGR
jgi:hypothetical protein